MNDLELYLSKNIKKFKELYELYMYREINVYEFAGHLGVDVETLKNLIDIFTSKKDF